MIDLTFVLPHWVYWSGLILFPLMAMAIVRRAGTKPGGGVNLPTAYLFWFSAGFVGIHRFYLRNFWGAVYIPLFILILLANVQQRDARLVSSNANNDVLGAVYLEEQARANVAENRAGAASVLAEAERASIAARDAAAEAKAGHTRWEWIVFIISVVVGSMLVVDAFLLPGLTRRCAEREGSREEPEKDTIDLESVMATPQAEPSRSVHTPITDLIDRISGFTGEFVGYWSIIAVFVYYYEVVARYVFNSPTNWAHEGMFLMFGMQYLLSGAFVLREGAHVRVDVLYLMFSDRAKAMIDILTSLFFFIFVGALLVTGTIFALDSVEVLEVSFTEWAIQYWPVKLMIVLGAILLLLQGVSKLVKDVAILVAREA